MVAGANDEIMEKKTLRPGRKAERLYLFYCKLLSPLKRWSTLLKNSDNFGVFFFFTEYSSANFCL